MRPEIVLERPDSKLRLLPGVLAQLLLPALGPLANSQDDDLVDGPLVCGVPDLLHPGFPLFFSACGFF